MTAAGPLSVSALRLTIAAVPVVVLAAARRRFTVYDVPTERRLLWAGAALAAHFACWFASLQHASVAVSTLPLCSSSVLTEIWNTVRTRRLRPLALCGAAGIAAYLLLVRASDPRYTALA